MPVCCCSTFQEVGDSLRHIADFSQRWVRKSSEQDAAQRLAAQQQLLDSAGHFGQLLCLCVMGLVALRAGRLSQVHQVGVIKGGENVTRRHIRHTSMALPTGMELAETLRWGKPQPPSVV